MKKLLVLAVYILLAPVLLQAAQVRPYIGAAGGYTDSSVKLFDGVRNMSDDGMLYNFTAGVQIYRTRLELAYNGRKAMKDELDLETGGVFVPIHASLKMHALLANVYQNLYEEGGTSFYVGAGAGKSWSESEVNIVNYSFKDRDSGLITALYAGWSVRLSRALVMDFGADWYRWKHMGRKVINWTPRLGVRWGF